MGRSPRAFQRTRRCSWVARRPRSLRVKGIPFYHRLGCVLIPFLRSFVGVNGVYYSLKHLSLSEAIVLSFLAPFATAISGSVFLGEILSVGHILAGCMSRKACLESFADVCSVLNIFGVICIAQPVYLFGQLPTGGTEDPEFRLLAVGCVN